MFVDVFQVLGFDVDTINSVQFSNHTGKCLSTKSLYVSMLSPSTMSVCLSVCPSVI